MFLLVLNLIFTMLNFAMLLPLIKIAADLVEKFGLNQNNLKSPVKEEPGLVDIETPQLSYHHVLPSSNNLV